MKPRFERKLVGATLFVYDDKVVIKQNLLGKLNKGLTKGDKTIYFKNIIALEVREAGSMLNGYLQFTIAGGREARGGLMSSIGDENTINFKKTDNGFIKEVREFIEARINNNNGGNTISNADELIKYKNMLDQGIIDEEEFKAIKTKILGL